VARAFPAYLELGADTIERRAREAVQALSSCAVCPRCCGVNRLENETQICRTGRRARVSTAFAHFGEEDCLRGQRGSGTIFFSCCNLQCVFCQNHDTSQTLNGREVDAEQLAELMLDLEGQGCHNVNFVTPEHVVPQVLEAVAVAVRRGIELPLVYNTGTYDSLQSLRLLDGVVDIYMPDFKLWTAELAARYLGAVDYPEVARAALTEMHRQVGPLELDADGVARRGVLVRHLVMPGLVGESRAIFEFLASLSPDIYVNVMAQYRPQHRAHRFPEIARGPTAEEMRAALDAFHGAGLYRLDDRAPLRLADRIGV